MTERSNWTNRGRFTEDVKWLLFLRHGNVENCRLCRWKTHSQPMEKDRPFPQPTNRFPTATPRQAVDAHSHNAGYCGYPFHPFLSDIKRKNKKRAGVQPSDEPKSCTPVLFRRNGSARNGEQESGKQCKAVPTLRKLPISALAETDSFVLVEAPPQSPQNTKVVFWNAG